MTGTRGYIAIWFFIGLLLFIYGLLILGAGIYNLFSPPEHPVAMGHLHADVWWGILLLVLGGFYGVRFFPRGGSRSGERPEGS